jgi:mRNA-degrading endonuclease RelE of RelBE toxin-antitoxin system
MAKRKVIWSRLAKKKLYGLIESIIAKDNNKVYAAFLWEMILIQLKYHSRNPGSGVKTSADKIYAFRLDDYVVLYEIKEQQLLVHSLYIF